MMKSISPWAWAIVLSAVAAGLVTLVADDANVRVVFVLWFLLICPGMMLVRFFRLDEPALEWVLAIALSLAVDAFVAGILLYSSRWSPSVAFAILLALTVGGVFAQELHAVRIQRRKLA